jgi:hypothetical protein
MGVRAVIGRTIAQALKGAGPSRRTGTFAAIRPASVLIKQRKSVILVAHGKRITVFYRPVVELGTRRSTVIGRIGPKIPQALLWIALGSLLGCGSGENSPSLSNTPPPPTADARADAEPVTPTDTDSPGPDDSKEPPSTDLPPNPPPTDTEEGSEDTVPSNDTNEPADTDSPDTQPFEPANLVPCNNDTDCENGWCVDTPTGAVCTPPCSPDCPDGWLCGLVSGE